MTKGLKAYEQILASASAWGKYSVGETVTMADVCLAPAVDGGIRFGVDFDELPNVWRVYGALQEIEAFKMGGWREQEDTPEEFRGESTKV